MTALELTGPVLAAGACHLASWRVGAWLRPLLFRREPNVAGGEGRAFLDAMLGVVAYGCLAFVLGALGILFRSLLIAAIVVPAAAGLAELALRARRGLRRPGLAALPMGAAVAIAIGFLPSALYPVLEADESVYHLLLPKLYLQHHATVALPWSLYANMPHLVDLTYAYPFALGGMLAAKVFVLGFTFWIFAGMAPCARAWVGAWGPGIFALLYLSGRNVQWHMGLANVEPVIGALLLGAVVCLRAWWEDRRRRGVLVLLGLLAGAACAAKYTVWPGAAALVAMVAAPRPGPGVPSRARRLALAAIPAVLVVAPWLVKAAIVTGNPVYPNLYRLLGGAHWSAVQDFQFRTYIASAGGAAKTWWTTVAIPFALVVAPFLYFGSASFSAGVMALLLASLVLPWRRADFAVPLRILAIAALVAWAAGSQQGRFLVAWMPVFIVAGGLALSRLATRPAALAAAVVAIVLAALAQVRLQPFRTRPVLDIVSVSRSDLVARNYGWPLCEALNRAVPPGGGVASLWENRLFFLDRPFIADSVYESPALLARLRALGDPAAFARELARDGVTHVVIHPGRLLDYVENRFPQPIVDGAVYPPSALAADKALLQRFVLEELEPVPSPAPWRIYRLRARSGIGNRATPPSTATGAGSEAR